MRLIDADALKYAITNHCRSEAENLNHFWYDGNIISLIDNAPTVAVDNYAMGYQDGVRKVLSERPQGDWIFTDNRWGLGDWECNKCHKYSNKDTNFCPNCGARMGDSE